MEPERAVIRRVSAISQRASPEKSTPAVFVRLTPDPKRRGTPVRAYRVAGCRLWIDANVPALEVFSDPGLKRLLLPASVLTDAWRSIDASPSDEQYEMQAWISGEQASVRCLRVAGGYVVETGTTRYFVRDDGRWVQLLERSSDRATAIAVLLGPVLVFSLALQHRWCLHASAVVERGGAILFLGESGCGKSTVAAWWPDHQPTACRMADDIAPVMMEGALYSLPTFPQRKLSDAQQFVNPAPIRVERLYVLRPGCADRPTARRLSSSEATLCLARHTVGARLFPEALMAAHLEFCAQVSECRRITEISYPHTPAALPGLKAIVDDDSNRF